MNLLLLLDEDFITPHRVRLTGRRLAHAREVLGAKPGDALKAGRLGGNMGMGRVASLDADALELEVELDQAPPPKLPLSLLLALPRPKVLDRCLQSAAALGVARIVLLNAWRVEKAYWASPKLDEAHLREQLILGLEQSRDTVLPELHLARLFVPFLEKELPGFAEGARKLLAHPGAEAPCPRGLQGPSVLALGPEGGWIASELESFSRAGFEPVAMGARVLRTETALSALIGRLA
ncbi:MAG TPA: 16S rRNA (uracil(1498)-N(3))-methyltransferase [Holophagaceae bacterium]|jgi:16S rRNA (uracil1498-N3)-methyltransferase|nr:16S rRNA (uracil(1498)-N(3))-methyltransferase [Holophagaceae bacterium]